MPETIFTGRVVMSFESLRSTNEYAHELLEKGKVIEGTAVRAAFQTGGKGYATNTWESDAGKNLLVSIILKPSFLQPKHQFFLNQAISLAVADSVQQLAPESEVKIKWPNDIFCDDMKIAGMLIENSVQGNTFLNSVAGIGLNVNQSSFSPHLPHATSLKKISGKEIELDTVFDLLCEKIESRYLQLKNNQVATIQKDYMKILYRVEEASLYSSAGKRFSAKIVGLTADGKLVLETGGEHQVFGFKELEMVI
jgi:BirA family biotin operon repressor/biotin-[acetyl-CoA-carboxylase] ligase